MNLHRYKAKLTSPGTGEMRYEHLGTWIGFAGVLLFFAHSVSDDMRGAFGGVSLSVGYCYLMYWLSTQQRVFLYILAFTSELIGISIWLSNSKGSCEFMTNLFCVNCCPSDKTAILSRCNEADPVTFVYSAYFLTVFLSSFYYIWRSQKKAV